MTEKKDKRLRTKDKGNQFNAFALFICFYLSSLVISPSSAVQ